MNTKPLGAFHAKFFAQASLISILIVGTAIAAAPDTDVRSQTVKFGDLNLQSDAGLESLYQRIHAAARHVCQTDDPTLWSAYAMLRCERKAEDGAITKLDVPGLTALYQKKTGRPAPMLAKNQ
jgi:UrcA family protein